jgi:hypothetical protein
LDGTTVDNHENSEDENNVGFEILTAVIMKCSVFWDITSVDFERTTRRYVSETRILHENNELPKQYGELVSPGEA